MEKKKTKQVEYKDVLSVNHIFEALNDLFEKITDARCIIPYEEKEKYKIGEISLNDFLIAMEEGLNDYYTMVVNGKNKIEKEYYM
jgi:hypothetical protein